MNAAHWHLMLNHVPITGAFFGLILWLFALKQNLPALYRFAFGWMIPIGLSAIPTYWTGEKGHELLHGLPDFNHDLVEIHETWGLYLLIAMLILAVTACLGIFSLKRSQGLPNRFWKLAISIILVVTTGMGIYTGHLGGQIHHPEMRPGFVPAEEGHEAGAHHGSHNHQEHHHE